MNTEETIAKALKIILKDHSQYKEVDSTGRHNIRRNIGTTLAEICNDQTAEELVADYNAYLRR